MTACASQEQLQRNRVGEQCRARAEVNMSVRLQSALRLALVVGLLTPPGAHAVTETKRPEAAQPAPLSLTDEERLIIRRKVRARSGSTLALGALAEGADVPRGVTVASFPKEVVEAVPKLAPYRYFSIENVIAIVDPLTFKVLMVVEGR